MSQAPPEIIEEPQKPTGDGIPPGMISDEYQQEWTYTKSGLIKMTLELLDDSWMIHETP